MAGPDLLHPQMFTTLCGQTFMPHVVIVTTMWSKVSEEEGIRREDELKRVFWKEMVAGGCRFE